MKIELPKFNRRQGPEKFPEHFTPLIKIPKFCADFGNKNLWVKDESAHGSWKQRKALYVAEEVEKRGVDKVVVITAGNAGLSIAETLKPKGTPVVAIIDSHVSEHIKQKLREHCYKVIEQDLAKELTEEEIIALARENPDEVIWDVTKGCEDAYKPIIHEILEQTKGISPEYIFYPQGQGEGFTGLAKALEELGLDVTGHERGTVLVGVRPASHSSPADKLNTAHKRAYQDVLFEKFAAGASFYGHMLMERINDEDIQDAYRYARPHITTSPSSAIVFAKSVRDHFRYTRFQDNRNPRRPSIIINSGGE